MDNTYEPRREHRRRRRGLFALLMAGAALISATGATMSLALFTSSPAALSADFTAGTIVLTLTPSTTLFTVGAMMPGDTVTQVLTVKNSGTGALRYALSSTFTETQALAHQIDVTVAPTPDTCANATAAIYSGKLFGVLFGSSAAGAQAGDRALAPGVTEYLCFTASLVKTTDNTYQGANATSTLTFSAEQTANNP